MKVAEALVGPGSPRPPSSPLSSRLMLTGPSAPPSAACGALWALFASRSLFD